MARPGEDELIARYFAPLAGDPGAHALRDDAALIVPEPGEALVVTVDTLVAGIHFLDDDPPGAIARKALRVNLSDLAAKGARPRGFLLSLALAPDWTEAWLAEFAAGLGDDVSAYGCALLGGDTVRTPGPLSLTVTAFGSVPAGPIPRRTGARPGDDIYVTGTIGDAAVGLLLHGPRKAAFAPMLGEAETAALVRRYLLPEPRTALAPVVLAYAGAAMDVSDGLVGDLAKLLRASGASARIDAAQVPLSPAVRAAIAADGAALETALTGGDDYEILLTVEPARAGAFEAAAAGTGVPVTRIGTVTAGDAPAEILGADGRPIGFARTSFSHF